MEKKTLMQISGEALEIYNRIEAMEGELTEQDNALLTINQSELKQKGIAYLEVMKQENSFIQRIDEEIERLQALKKSSQNKIGFLEYNLLQAQQTYGDFELGFNTVTTRISKAVEIELEDEIPEKYIKQKVTKSIDKTLIKKDIDAGIAVSGAKVVERHNLRIK